MINYEQYLSQKYPKEFSKCQQFFDIELENFKRRLEGGKTEKTLVETYAKPSGLVFVENWTSGAINHNNVLNLKPLWQYSDDKVEPFYLYDNKQPTLSITQLTKIRRTIISQRATFWDLPPELKEQIESDYASRRDFDQIPASAHPYQHYLRNRELERVFKEAIKLK